VRIVLVSTAYPLRGGMAHYAALLYHQLWKCGHDVRVLSFRRQYPSLLFPGKTQKDEGAELIHIDSTPLLDSINPLSWVRAFFRIKKIKPDAIIFNYWMPFFAPCYATIVFLSKYCLGIRTLYICHNIVPHEKKLGDHTLNRIGLRFIDYFIVQSRTVLKDLLIYRHDAVYRKVAHPVYKIFPPSILKQDARTSLNIREDRVLLYFGYIRKYKGLLYLIKAMPVIVEHFPVRLIICGEFYEGREEILQLIDELGLKSRVTVCDRFIPNEEVNRYFCAADMVVLPYISATQSGIVKVAYHYDRPVLVTNVGGLPEVVPHDKCGYVVPPEDTDAITKSILKFYRENKEDAFTKNVRKEKQKYTWDKMSKAIEELLQLKKT